MQHNVNKNLNLSMYIINITNRGKCMRTVFTHSLVCIRNLTRTLRSLVRFPILDQLVRKYRTHTLSMKYSIFVTYFLNISMIILHVNGLHNVCNVFTYPCQLRLLRSDRMLVGIGFGIVQVFKRGRHVL